MATVVSDEAIRELQNSVSALAKTVNTISNDLVEMKINLALMTGKFLGGWRVVVVIGGVVAAFIGWLISLHILSKGA